MGDETVVDVLREAREAIVLAVDADGRCDLGVVDAIAWVCLAAQRDGADARVRTRSAAIVELLALTGLDEQCDVVWEGPGSGPP